MKNIGILGGDLRIIFLSRMLAEDGYSIYTYGIDNVGENFVHLQNSNIVNCNSINEMCEFCDIIISSIPFSKDGINIFSPFSSDRIDIKNTFKLLSNKKIIAGAISQEIKENAFKNNIDLIDLMEDERLTILNIIPTVEGAIQVAMESTNHTIHSSNCLILGYGRIGKLLSKTLNNLGANVSVMARKDKDLTWIKVLGFKDIHIENLCNSLNGYDIIFNTIPTKILNKEKLKIIKENSGNAVIIELASSPGGIDYELADEYGIKVIKALRTSG